MGHILQQDDYYTHLQHLLRCNFMLEVFLSRMFPNIEVKMFGKCWMCLPFSELSLCARLSQIILMLSLLIPFFYSVSPLVLKPPYFCSPLLSLLLDLIHLICAFSFEAIIKTSYNRQNKKVSCKYTCPYSKKESGLQEQFEIMFDWLQCTSQQISNGESL